jgi:hypothetical protein
MFGLDCYICTFVFLMLLIDNWGSSAHVLSDEEMAEKREKRKLQEVRRRRREIVKSTFCYYHHNIHQLSRY